jgi:threonine/homoserine/homoserine lactone efflux protein
LGELILKAIVTGFILSIMIGPVFFILLETSIRKGIRAALVLDAGVLVSDLLYIAIAFFFFSEISSLKEGENEGLLQIVGGVFLIIYGGITFFKKPKEPKQDELGNIVHESMDYVKLFLKGFFLNIANPMVIFYWFSVMPLGSKNSIGLDVNLSMLIFILVLLLVFFSIDVLKIFAAKKLRRFVTDSVLRSLNRITGAILFAFGVVLLLRGILTNL